MKTVKYIFFKDKMARDRFIQLYGGIKGDNYNSVWLRNYFGPKVKDLYLVTERFSTEEINGLVKNICLKKKRWSGHLCYLFE